MKDLIQEGRKIQETFKKNVMVEDNFFSKFIGKKTSGISKYGNWDYESFDESPNGNFYVSYLQASNGFISKMNSNPSIKSILKNLGKMKESHVRVEGNSGKFSTDYIVEFQKLKISFDGGANRGITISNDSERDITSFGQKNKIDSNTLQEGLIQLGDILSSELQKEWNSKIWEKPNVIDAINKYYRKMHPNPDFPPVFPR